MSFVLAAVPGCLDNGFAPPSPLDIHLPAPAYVTPESLAADFAADPEKASNEYNGRRIYFGTLRVDAVSKTAHPMRLLEDYVLAGNVKYRPRYISDMDNIIQGTMLEVSGTVRGLQYGYVLVTDCWFRVVSGGGSTPGSY